MQDIVRTDGMLLKLSAEKEKYKEIREGDQFSNRER